MRGTLLALLTAIGSCSVLSRAARAAELSGTVRGPDGAPVAGALVAAVSTTAEGIYDPPTTKSGPDGSFRLTGLPAGTYGVTATAPGLEGAFLGRVPTRNGETPSSVVLALAPPRWSLRATVTDRKGREIAGTRLFAARVSEDRGDIWVAEAGPDGRVAIALPEAAYVVSATAPGFENESRSVRVGETPALILRLESSAEARSPASEPVVAAVRAAAIPLTTVEAGHGFRDMAPLKEVVGSSRIVALGEATHGTREFFQLKHRMLEFLVSEMGFTVFAIEANWPEALAVDDYVLSGRGDPAKALAGMYFWTWNTEEVLDLIRWMRRWNEDPVHVRKIRFAGVDMQYPPVAAKAVRDYLLRGDPECAKSLAGTLDFLMGPDPRSALSNFDASKRNALRKAVEELGTRMDARHAELVPKTSEVDWRLARQHVRILSQFEEMVRKPAENVRDRAMAENAAWVLGASEPNARMALWAHNGHVSRDPDSPMGATMGADLATRFGKDLVIFGFAFDEGSFQAVGNGALRNFTVVPAPPGSIDAMLAATGIPLFALDLRGLPPDSPASRWLDSRRMTRSIGAMYDPAAAEKFFVRQIVPSSYDVLLFVAKTTAAKPNPSVMTAPAFKLPPPAPAAVNLGFEDGPASGAPVGWTVSKQATDDGWTVAVTNEKPREGKFAAVIARSRADAPQMFGNVMQRFDATPWRGKRVRFRAAVRVEAGGTGGRAQMWLRVDLPGGKMGFFDNMGDRPIRDADWRVYEIAGDVAEDANAIAFGVMLIGGGKTFVDDVSLSEVPASKIVPP
ncbi:MAG: erythromycin esterase family protein [Acidobacteriota bacterium]